MHSTGYFIEDKHAFSKKNWGNRTAIYVKLATKLSTSQWTGFYGSLEHTEDVDEKMREFSKPVVNWSGDPDNYRLISSDSSDEE